MLNFNVDPYYDDFDPSKNFHRILFKPGNAVQARELTQAQTILQDQISKFADNIFTQNTPVSGGKVTTNLNCYYLKLVNSTGLVAESFLNKVITDSTGTILAKVIKTAETTSTSTTIGDPPTLIVSYLSGVHFSDGAQIFDVDTQNPALLISSGSTGKSSLASISSGVFYIVNGYSQSNTQNQDGSYTKYSIGNFVSVQPQTVILNKYSNKPSYKVGLSITETIYDYINDSSLLDPALGSTNYQAPGADRYVIELTLLPTSLDSSDDQFIELLRIKDGTIIKQVNGTVYSTINDYIAKRDYETNGDYVVNDFKLTPTRNGGKNNPISDPNKYDMIVGPGIAYVQGYRVENQSQLTLTSDRARDTKTKTQNSVYIDYGSYYITDTMSGVFDVTTMPQVDLHCVGAGSINSANVTTYTSTLVGTAFIRNIDYVSSTSTNTQTYVYHTYVSDINTNSLTGTAASGTSTTIVLPASPSGKWSTTANAYYNTTLTLTGGTGIGQTRRIVSWNNTTRTATVDKAFTTNPDSTTTFSINFSTSDVDSIVQKNGSYVLTAKTNVNISGKLNSLPLNPTVLNDPAGPEMLYKVGYPYVSSVTSADYYSTMRWSNQGFSSLGPTSAMTLTAPTGVQFQGELNTPIYGEQFKQLYTLIDTSSGAILNFSNTSNYLTLTDSTHATFTTTDYTALTSGVTVIANMYVSGGNLTAVLKTKTLVTGTTSTAGSSWSTVTGSTKIDLTAGQSYIPAASIVSGSAISLYVADVKKIKLIVDTGSSGTSISNGATLSSFDDVTTSFFFNNGQSDNFYGHASITLKPGVVKPSGNILVVYDFYSHGGGDGYFSINSYTNESYAEIPTYTASNGNVYKLTDCIDFRPSRKNGVTSYTWEYYSPSSTTHGILIPNDLSQFQSTYSYYLGRNDKLILTKDGVFQIIKGTSSTSPALPQEPKGSLLLANLFLDPYTAFVPGEKSGSFVTNLTVNKVLHKRWAKSDITDLQDQVNNLEYYTSLSLLEQNANSLQVPDANGLNRFKNGILVDDFSSFGTIDSYNQDYNAKINIRTKQLTPITDVQSYKLHNPVVLKSLGTLKATNTYNISPIEGTESNIFTLPYTTSNVVVQQLASSVLSVNPFSVTVSEGVLSLNPPTDGWCNSIETPAILTNDPNLQHDQITWGKNLVNAGDWQSIPGTKSNVGITPTLNNNSYTSQNNNNASPNGNSMVTNKGFVTNNAMQPFIRPQEVIVKVKGMKSNTPIKAWFDGKNINKWMISANVITLQNVQGTFLENDIIGFYESLTQQFYAIARVISVEKTSANTVRLYVATLVGVPSTITNTTTIINAYYNSNGNFASTTASGAVSGTYINAMHTSGTVTNVGGGFTSSTVPTTTNFYKVPAATGYSTFLNQNGIWGSVDATVTTFQYFIPVTFAKTGTYTFHMSADNYAEVKINGASATTGTMVVATTNTYQDAGQSGLSNVYQKTYTGTTVISSTGDKNIGWSVTGTIAPGNIVYTGHRGSFAMTITDPDGFVVWSTLQPPGLGHLNAGTKYDMPQGGQYYAGATQFQLDSNASSVADYYKGGRIYIKSTWTYEYHYGAQYIPSPPNWAAVAGDGDAGRYNAWVQQLNQYYATVKASNNTANVSSIILASTETYTANITSYNASTKVVTLDVPVDISVGKSGTYGVLNSAYSIEGLVTNTSLAIQQGTTLSQLSTDTSGNFVGVFSMPGSEFYVGERVLRLDNRTVDSDPTTATTYAEATFHASGLQNQTSFAPSVDSSGKIIKPIDLQAYTLINNPTPHIDPLAQSFLVQKDNYPNGLFIKSIKLFFLNKPTNTNTPVRLSLVETENGYPNGKTIPHSRVTKYPSEVKVSNTPHYLNNDTATVFEFSAPIYIQPGVMYAMVLESGASEYTVYYAEQNQLALVSTSKVKPTDNTTTQSKIGTAPYTGTLFESQNGITWTADQNKCLMFTIEKCVFNTSVAPEIEFVTPKNLPQKTLGRNDILHKVDPNSVIDLKGTFGPTQTYHEFNISTTDFIPSSTSITYQQISQLASDLSYTDSVEVFPGKAGTPLPENIHLDDGKGPRILSRDSGNSFIMMATLSSTDANVSPVISDDGVAMFSVSNFINNMGIDSNIINITNGGTGYDASNVTITISDPDIGSDKPVFGFTLNGNVLSSIYTTYPGSGYLKTPTITVSDPLTRGGNSNAVVTVSGETSPSGGNGYARYITKKVVLTPSNESGDLRVYYTAYKPLNTQVYVYYKIQNPNDTDKFENQSWQLMTQVGKQTTYSTNRNNFIEFECAPGSFGLADNSISYTSTNGKSYTSFTQFCIKIVMATTDPTSTPILSDLRALALPAGSGI